PSSNSESAATALQSECTYELLSSPEKAQELESLVTQPRCFASTVRVYTGHAICVGWPRPNEILGIAQKLSKYETSSYLPDLSRAPHKLLEQPDPGPHDLRLCAWAFSRLGRDRHDRSSRLP